MKPLLLDDSVYLLSHLLPLLLDYISDQYHSLFLTFTNRYLTPLLIRSIIVGLLRLRKSLLLTCTLRANMDGPLSKIACHAQRNG